ncbi:abortive infection protein [Streptomyces zinciresistens K42]|uniref:Abortive infection protein n=1 Tax=Streptomyces zinciresistens K42 TaxID=700597 RepID=G2GLU9_9ACTN|nr:CPBP family intramembrane glutamic endopeptidase [Streptomyces zinciresistens]EGX55508.1 abortive infection protein [Streptomyces zinciresistens K42]
MYFAHAATRLRSSLTALFAQTPVVPSRPARSAAVRLLVPAAALVLVTALAAGVRALAGDNPVLSLLGGAVIAIGALCGYAALVRFLEQRPVTELDPARAVPGLRSGTLTGMGLFTAVLALIALSADYGTEGGVSLGGALTVLGLMAGVAVAEELLFRGVLFRVVEELAGTVGALAVSAALFGGLHLLNPGATVRGALAIAVEAGLMLGAAYVATGALWLPIGLHFGWNFALSGVFGVTVSGDDSTPAGLLRGVLTGPEAVTGGGFGPEASVFAVLVCTILTVLLLRSAKRRGRMVRRASRAARAERD